MSDSTNEYDYPLPEDAEIEAAHPLKTGRHDLYAEANRLVSAKHSKAALVSLVNWLLLRTTVAEERAQRAERDAMIAKSINAEIVGERNSMSALVDDLQARVDALTADKERAERELEGERENYTSMCSRYKLDISEARRVADEAKAIAVRKDVNCRELETTIATLTPLAEEGRKAVQQEINDLQLIGDGKVHSVYWGWYERDGLAEYWTTDDDMVEHIELTGKGREHLAYLRTLVGEEKAE
ncbi:MAG TPA: hypothetical protein VN519_06335 [Bryobacteraceae bacterium]|nr:hypothetical protein [Bryobacteraceae bacterium]